VAESKDHQQPSEPISKGGGGPPGPLTDLLARVAGGLEKSLPEGWGDALRVGTAVGRFEILRELGRGGFGVVYEALDLQLGRLVAFKALRGGDPSRARDRGAQLQAEAEAAARLSHPNIVTLHDVGLSADPPYLVLELLRGETLAERLRRGSQPLDEALRIAVEVGRALEHAHDAGVIHRDLKPSNVFLTAEGRVKVLDFGLAQVLGRSTQGGGTPAYMAPEQWREEAQVPSTDVFSAGAVLFESLCGQLPYRRRDGRSEVLEPGPEPRLPLPAPRSLDRLLQRALSRDPADRPCNGRAWVEELLAVQRLVARRSRWAGKRRRLVLAGASLLVVASALGLRLLFAEWRETRRREATFYYERARTAFLEESPGSVRSEAVGLALGRARDLVPRERGLLQAWDEQLRGEDEAALGLYDRLLRTDPADRETAYLGGDLLFHRGRLEEAIPWLEVGATGERPLDWALDHLAVALHELGRREDLVRLGQRLAGRPPTAGVLHALSIAWGSIGEQAASLAAARRELQAGGGATALDDMVASLFQAGELARAEALLRERLSLEGPGSIDARHALAVVLGAQGRRREGLAVWDATATGWTGDLAWHRLLRAVYRAGDGAAAPVWLDAGDVSWPAWAAFDVAWVLAYLGDAEHVAARSPTLGPLERRACDAILRYRRGRPADAAGALEAIVSSPEWRHGGLAFVRAEVALGAGRPREAVELLAADRARYRRLPLGMLQAWMFPRGLYLEALAHERLGERREARATIHRLLASWRDADPDQKLLTEARALRDRLEGPR
jgi:tetratricopeptide (TPR) repeat protein